MGVLGGGLEGSGGWGRTGGQLWVLGGNGGGRVVLGVLGCPH